MDEVRVVFCDFPPRIYGLTVGYYDEDGQLYYTILINSRLSYYTNRCTYFHEMEHIRNQDFEHIYSVDDLENLRHSL